MHNFKSIFLHQNENKVRRQTTKGKSAETIYQKGKFGNVSSTNIFKLLENKKELWDLKKGFFGNIDITKRQKIERAKNIP